MSPCKVTNLHQIVRLRQMVKKWQKLTNIEKRFSSFGCVINPKKIRSLSRFDSDDESSKQPCPPPDVPEGCLAVYVGLDRKRYIIRTSYLNHPHFRVLLDKAEEEFGFDQQGGLTLPCEAVIFEHLLLLLGKKDSPVQNATVYKFFKVFFSKSTQNCSTEASLMGRHSFTADSTPLLFPADHKSYR
eukprot:c26232_g1_i1 orf=739-1296(-)